MRAPPFELSTRHKTATQPFAEMQPQAQPVIQKYNRCGIGLHANGLRYPTRTKRGRKSCKLGHFPRCCFPPIAHILSASYHSSQVRTWVRSRALGKANTSTSSAVSPMAISASSKICATWFTSFTNAWCSGSNEIPTSDGLVYAYRPIPVTSCDPGYILNAITDGQQTSRHILLQLAEFRPIPRGL